MAGPTGPDALRDDAAEFQRLIRRRLLAAAPDETPFARCAKSAREIVPEPLVERTHLARARSFAEYGVDALDTASARLSDLKVGTQPLVARTRDAWPFVSGSTARLIRPSFGAREAIHPLPPARPLLGRGLPGTRALPKNSWHTQEGHWLTLGSAVGAPALLSTDFGQSFRLVRGAPGAEAREGRCAGRDPQKGFALSSGADGSLLVTSQEGEHAPETQLAVRGEHRLLAMACDDDALTLVAAPESGREPVWVLCLRAGSCGAFSPPRLAPFSPLASAEFDLARVQGATVIAVASRGVVRVASSRDNGQTWTPSAVAFDAAEYPDTKAEAPVPTRLTALGTRLLLHGAPVRTGQSYALLVSDDQGASFRGEGGAITAPEAPRVAGARRSRSD